MFVKNEGSIERGVRMFLGIAVLSTALIVTAGVLQWILIAISIILFVTGVIGFCPLYTVIGLITRQKQFCPTCSENETATNKRR